MTIIPGTGNVRPTSYERPYTANPQAPARRCMHDERRQGRRDVSPGPRRPDPSAFRGTADMAGPTDVLASVENDPSRKSSTKICCDAQRLADNWEALGSTILLLSPNWCQSEL